MSKRRRFSAEEYARLRYRSYRSQPPFQNLDEFLVLTDPPEPEPQPAQPAPASAEGGENPENAAESARKPRCTKRQKLERLNAIATWLEKSVPMLSIVLLAKQKFGLGRRSVQLYVREVKKRWAEAAQKEDYVAHLWKSNLQYDNGIHETFRALQTTDDPKLKASLLRVNLAFIKAKDDCMASLQLHRRKARRDQSPDSFRERNERENMVTMPVGELLERTDNMRREWRQEFQNEFEKAHGLATPMPKVVNGEFVYEPLDPNRKRPVQVNVLPKSPPSGWGREWQRREEEKAKEKLKKELGFKE